MGLMPFWAFGLNVIQLRKMPLKNYQAVNNEFAIPPATPPPSTK